MSGWIGQGISQEQNQSATFLAQCGQLQKPLPRFVDSLRQQIIGDLTRVMAGRPDYTYAVSKPYRAPWPGWHNRVVEELLWHLRQRFLGPSESEQLEISFTVRCMIRSRAFGSITGPDLRVTVLPWFPTQPNYPPYQISYCGAGFGGAIGMVVFNGAINCMGRYGQDIAAISREILELYVFPPKASND